MATKRPAESTPETPEPETKKPASAKDKFLAVVVDNIRKHDLKCCMGGEGIHWEMWADKYFETQEHREKRKAPMLNEPLLTLAETFAANLMDNYIGNFELQLVLHTMIYHTFTFSSKARITEFARALEEIRANCPKGKMDEERWFKIMNEVINRYNFKYSPLIEDCLTYWSGHPIGICPSDW